MGDAALAGRLAEDLDGAFPALVRAHQHRIYSLALRLTGDAVDAEELAHDVFVRAYRALSGYPPERRRQIAVRPWLATIALNAGRNEARRSKRLDRLATAEEHADARPGPEAEAVAGRGQLAEALRALPHAQRCAVLLRHVNGLSYAEIAAAMERPVGTVKTDVHRALVTLRTLLKDEEDR